MGIKNYKATVTYLGDRFCGFAIQKNVVTVQEEIEKAIAKVSGQMVRVNGAGRTDAGVHAVGQVINFCLKTRLKTAQLKRAINAHLKKDVQLDDCVAVSSRFHARFSARSRKYVYNILAGSFCPLYIKPFVWHLTAKLDLSSMQKAARILIGTHNFLSFSKGCEDGKSYVRKVHSIDFRVRPVSSFFGVDQALKVKLISITFKANAFTRGMVRAMVGTLVLVGQTKLTVADFKKIVAGQNRTLAGENAPAQGLCLVQVKY